MMLPRDWLEEAVELVYQYRDDPEKTIARVLANKALEQRSLQRTAQEVADCAAATPSMNKRSLEALSERLDSINVELLARLVNPRSEIEPGFTARWTAVSRVGVYVPARMPSTAFTFLSAARAAGVREIVMYAAQDRCGELDPLTALAALRYGAEVWCGPARLAFPFLAFGIGGKTGGCEMVCGPCSTRMNLVKQIACVVAGAATDMWAGASELAVVADETANWDQLKRDLNSQLEHGPDSTALLVLIGVESARCWQDLDAAEPQARLRISVVEGAVEAAGVVNGAAPETVEIWTRSAADLAELVHSAGVVYLHASSSLGDYGVIGRGCADPTNRLARAQSGLSPLTFLRLMPVVSGQAATSTLIQAAGRMAAHEGLQAHRRAIEHGLKEHEESPPRPRASVERQNGPT